MTIEVVAMGNAPTKAIVIGSVSDTIAARISTRLQNRRFHALDYLAGFEAASPRDLESIGESVLVNGFCYATSTSDDESHGKVLSGKDFVTGGIFLLPKGAKPSHQVRIPSATKYGDLLSEIYQKVGHPVAFTGFLTCETLYTMAVEKPPIGGKPIFENKEYYFPSPHRTLSNVYCFAVGVMTSYTDSRFPALNKQLELVLYKNPFDPQGGLTSHTHCLVLKSNPTKTSEITPSLVAECRHLFTDKTVVKMGNLDLFALDQVIQE